MCLDHLALTPGRLAKHGWGKFQIDQRGDLALEQKKMPPDLRVQIRKVLSDLTKISDLTRRWQLGGVWLHSQRHHRYYRPFTMSILLYRTGIGVIPSSKSLDTCM